MCPALNHKVHKGQGCKLISIYRNPVIDEVILKATKDAGDLQFIVNTSFGIYEVIEASYVIHAYTYSSTNMRLCLRGSAEYMYELTLFAFLYHIYYISDHIHCLLKTSIT